MKQVRGNPSSDREITPTTYAFSSTGASGAINASGGVNLSALETGQSIFLGLDSGNSNGFEQSKEYFVIPVSSAAIKVAATYNDAVAGTYLTSASGDANTGDIYPTYKVGGVIFVGTGGNVNIRGIQNDTESFSLHKNVGNGTTLPFMIKDIWASGTTATDIVVWND